MMKIKGLMKKYKEIILYLIFGALTTAVSIGVFALTEYLEIHELIGNIISWVIAVMFAFFTNRIWVFESRTDSVKSFFKQLLLFCFFRLFTFFVEEFIIFIFITILKFNSILIKVIAQVLVIILNFILSKLIVFKKKNIKIEMTNANEVSGSGVENE